MNSLKDRPVNRTKNPAQIDPNCRGTTWHEAWHGVARSPKTVARCGTAVARRGTGLASHCFKAIFYRGTRSYFQCSVKTVEYGLKALLYNAIVAKHLMVSQVCLSYRPEWATTGNSSRSSSGPLLWVVWPLPSPSCQVWSEPRPWLKRGRQLRRRQTGKPAQHSCASSRRRSHLGQSHLLERRSSISYFR